MDQRRSRATVTAYFETWRRLMLQGRVVKSAQIQDLERLLPARNGSAIEYKFRNISAVMEERRDIWLTGYRPLRNIQASLRAAVDAYLSRNGEFVAMFEAHSTNILPAPTGPEVATEDVLVDPPSAKPPRASQLGIQAGAISAVRDFQLRELGRSGEAWVIDRERRSLERAGRDDLASQIRWVAKEFGDGLGYDIESFRPSGSPLLIEVKTTNYGIGTPFFISRNEVRVSRDHASAYALYRVFDFRLRPHLYRLEGSVETKAKLEPIVFEGFPI